MNARRQPRLTHGITVATIATAAFAHLWAASGPDLARAEGSSIAELLARAPSGATIVVPPGTYYERLVIDRPVTLVGEGWPVIDAGGEGDVVLVTAPDVTLRGFAIEHSGRDVVAEPAGIRVRGDRATIENNRLTDVLYGIVLEDSSGHRVSGNRVASILDFHPERRGHALYLWHTSDNLIEENTVVAAKDGVFLGYASHNRVERNHVTGARYGIHYMYADHNAFLDNVFRDSMAGAAIMFSRDISFRGNEFAYNRSPASGYGLLFKDVDDVLMVDNRVHHNRVGITLEGAPLSPDSVVTVTRNLVGFNDTALVLATTTGVLFTENAFAGNLEQVAITGGRVEHRNTWAEGGRGNYWDDYQGYDANRDGVGDIAYRYEGAFDELVRRNEWVRLYAFTPAHTALELAMRWFPSFQPAARVVDPAPLLAPTVRLRTERSAADGARALPPVLALLGVPLLLWWRVGRTRAASW